ncbi:hypothetical protein NHJ13734_007195 [Beauveria thailandica]
MGEIGPKRGVAQKRIIERLQALRASAAGNNFGSRCPSVSLGVSFDDQTTYEWNFGRRDLKQNLALNVDTVHGIGSLSKKFTASAIGILVDEGRLSWQTSVREILREYHSRSQFTTQELTVEDLLSHRSGMAHSHYWWYGAGGELLIDKSQTMSFINGLKSASSLRSISSHSNWKLYRSGRDCRAPDHSNEAGNIDKLFWAHDGSVPAKEQFFVKVTLDQ